MRPDEPDESDVHERVIGRVFESTGWCRFQKLLRARFRHPYVSTDTFEGGVKNETERERERERDFDWGVVGEVSLPKTKKK